MLVRENPTKEKGQSNTVTLNDCHSQLNQTQVAAVSNPRTVDDLQKIVRQTSRSGNSLIPFGGRHAMGSQQFASNSLAVNTRGLNRILGLDSQLGVIEVEAGITWTEVLRYLQGRNSEWAIAQKQTGADDLTLGGSLASNVHGRGLQKAPLIEDIVSFTVVDPSGELLVCSRQLNSELFRMVIGGYGLFGIVYSVQLQLAPKRKVRRIVRTIESDSLIPAFDDRIKDGFEYGDFQFQIDDESPDFLQKGIFSCYQPVPDTQVISDVRSLKKEDWMNLLHLAHVDKSRGFQLYQDHYLQTDGAVYWSDSHQFTTYVDGYHEEIDRRIGSRCKGSEMISELYVPRDQLPQFLEQAKFDLRRLNASVIYGTVRLIEADKESFLPWAKENFACVIFNICVEHSQKELAKARTIFRRLIDIALSFGGSFYLTYHKFARKDQVQAAYPRFEEFLRIKKCYDRNLVFQSNWWSHYERMFSNA